MLVMVFTEDHDVVKVYKDELAQTILKHRVHDSLERGRGVRKPEWLHFPLILSDMRTQRSLLDVIVGNAYLVIPRRQVETAKDRGPL